MLFTISKHHQTPPNGDTDLEIIPSDTNPSRGTLTAFDAKLVQLIKSFADRPLVLEKLVLNQTQGLLLRLVNQTNDKTGALNLQLPLRLSPLFDNVSRVKPQLSIILATNQRVVIGLTEVPSAIQAGSPRTTISPVIDANRSLAQQVLQFKTAQLLPNNTLRLAEASPATNQQIESLTALPIKRSSERASSLTSAKTANENNPVAASEISSKTTPATSVSAAASQILNRHFTKQNPVATHLTRIKQIINQLKMIDNPPPTIRRLISQIESLISSLKISSLPTGESIKQRIRSSGNLLENTASRMIKGKSFVSSNAQAMLTQTNSLKSSLTQSSAKINNSDIPESLRHFVKSDTSKNKVATADANTSAKPKITAESKIKQPTDLKLQLMQIRATLESVIKGGLGKLASLNPQNTDLTGQPSGTIKQTSKQTSGPTNTSTNSTPNPQARALQIPALLTQAMPQSVSTQPAIEQNNRKSAAKPMMPLTQQSAIFKQTNELLTEVRAMVSQIESNQLHSLRAEQPNLQQFLVDLPFGNEPDIDSFELLFEHSKDDSNPQKVKSWKVVVRFDLEPLGAMFAQIQLINERISTHIFAESQHTAVLIDEHMHVLKKSLSSAGVNIDELKSSQGNIPDKLMKADPNQVDVRV